MPTAQEISRAKTNPVSRVMRGYVKLRAFARMRFLEG